MSGRLEAGLKSWTECLKGSKTSRHVDDTDTSMMAHKPGGDPDIQVRDQVLFTENVCTFVKFVQPFLILTFAFVTTFL